jgi:homoserine dehydrogenase
MDVPFSEILKAIDSGFTEPDQREDLGGNDVGRKLLILEELDLQNEFEEIDIQNLIPEHLREGSADFLTKLKFDAIMIKVIKTKSCAALHWKLSEICNMTKEFWK